MGWRRQFRMARQVVQICNPSLAPHWILPPWAAFERAHTQCAGPSHCPTLGWDCLSHLGRFHPRTSRPALSQAARVSRAFGPHTHLPQALTHPSVPGVLPATPGRGAWHPCPALRGELRPPQKRAETPPAPLGLCRKAARRARSQSSFPCHGGPAAGQSWAGRREMGSREGLDGTKRSRSRREAPRSSAHKDAAGWRPRRPRSRRDPAAAPPPGSAPRAVEVPSAAAPPERAAGGAEVGRPCGRASAPPSARAGLSVAGQGAGGVSAAAVSAGRWAAERRSRCRPEGTEDGEAAAKVPPREEPPGSVALVSCVPPSPEAAAGKVTREDGDCGDEAGALPAPEVRAGQRRDRPAPPGRRDTRSAAAPRPSRWAPPPPPPPAPGCAETAGSHREGNLGSCRLARCGADTSGGRRAGGAGGSVSAPAVGTWPRRPLRCARPAARRLFPAARRSASCRTRRFVENSSYYVIVWKGDVPTVLVQSNYSRMD